VHNMLSQCYEKSLNGRAGTQEQPQHWTHCLAMQQCSSFAPKMFNNGIAAAILFALPATALGAVATADFEAGSVHVDRYGSGNPAPGP